MAKLLSGFIRSQVNKHLSRHVLPATLTKLTAGTRTPGAYSAGTNPTSTDYAARGFVSDYSDGRIDGTTIMAGDREITLLGGSIAGGVKPATGDTVTIADYAGQATTTYRIVGPVKADADGAAFSLQARRQ